jgi:hypothetical protein
VNVPILTSIMPSKMAEYLNAQNAHPKNK